MSSKIPRIYRLGRFAKNFNDLDGNIKFVCKVVKASLQKDCYVFGSYANGGYALDSDLDIKVKNLETKDRIIVSELSVLLNVKIDISLANEENVNELFQIK